MPGPIRRLVAGFLVTVLVAGGPLVAPPAALAATGVAGSVQVSGVLRARAGAATNTAAVGTLRNNARIRVACTVPGEYVRGSVRSTRSWDRLTNGSYVSHAYVRTSATVPGCAARGTRAVPVVRTTTVTGTVASGDGPVNLRGAPSTGAPIVGTAANGSRLSLTCAVTGEYVVGTVRSTTQWDRLTDGRYVSHGYLVSAALPVCTGVAAPTATMTNAQFIAAAVPGAQQGWREFGVPPSVTIAQAILESGWGRSGLAAVDRNYFGIKCFDGSPGRIAAGCHTYRTTECDKAGKCFATEATFRAYRSTADSFRDHGHFLRVNSRYKPAFAYTRDANRFLWTMWKAGYATDPAYYTKVTDIMRTYQLYQYDTWR